jgi:hypothetical protein
MYIVGQEETAGESSVSVVAGVRTVTTNMDGRDVLPRLSRPFAFSAALFNSNFTRARAFANMLAQVQAASWNARFCKLEYTLNRSSASPTCLTRREEFGHCRGCKFAQKRDRTNTK